MSFEQGKAEGYQGLSVWQKGINYVEKIYRVTSAFPKEEMYGLISQMRRAAVSIPANIAEGYARRSDAEFARFLLIAAGSSAELETHVIIAHRLSFITLAESDEIMADTNELGKMLHGMHRSITQRKAA
ncbi:MAG: four helix bundle protein [Rickettsiales bacterium]|nr:four helix bundle protein [Rickettsiales bacterium]